MIVGSSIVAATGVLVDEERDARRLGYAGSR